MFDFKKREDGFMEFTILIASIALFFSSVQYLVILPVLLYLFNCKIDKVVFTKSKLPFLFIFLYVLWTYTSLIYSSNLREGAHYIEKGLPLFMIAFLGLFTKPKIRVSFDYFRFSYRIGATVFLLVCIAYLFYAYFSGHLLGQINVNGLSNVDSFNPFMHRTYASSILLMGVVVLAEDIIKGARSRVVSVVGLFIILAFVYWSGARVAFVSACILLATLFVVYALGRMKKVWLYVSFISLIAIFAMAIISSPRMQRSIWDVKQGLEISRSFDRYTSWKTALAISKDHLLLGVGVGDVQDELNKRYISSGFTLSAHRNLNVHNQYLQTLIETGVIGVLLLLAFFVSLIYSLDKRQRIYAVSFVVIYGVNFMFESMLLRNIAVFPIVFWLFVFYSNDNDAKGEVNSKWNGLSTYLMLALIASVSVLMLILSHRIGFDSDNPRTYMSVESNIVDFDDLPMNECLPRAAKGALFDSQNVSLRPDNTGEFMSFDIYKFRDDSHQKVIYTYWCYVSDDSNLEKVVAYIYNKDIVSVVTPYDLTQKGTWQCLRLEVEEVLKYTGMGARLDVLEEEKIQGCVIFTLPEITFNEQ